ncbi:MAG: 4-(cytidine 5'-diphospho)-2-C-methyl-D-erythritol kinase [Syntrophomonas sp.]
MGSRIEIEAPAKVNLTLDVKGKRADGYHELETVMHQIDLVDRISIGVTDDAGTRIKLTSNSGDIPGDESNLAWRAAQIFLDRNHLRAGVEIFIEKNIPVGAGLAGGSTDAAAVIQGLNALLGCRFEKKALLEMAAFIGSDVPFCLLGGTAVARGRGEILEPLYMKGPLFMVLVKPDFGISTAEVYQGLDLNNVAEWPDTTAFLKAWEKYDIINLSKNLANVLESVSISKHPEIKTIKEMLINEGAINALMSGSGPSVFGIFETVERAQNAAEIMKNNYREVFLVSSYERRGDCY